MMDARNTQPSGVRSVVATEQTNTRMDPTSLRSAAHPSVRRASLAPARPPTQVCPVVPGAHKRPALSCAVARAFFDRCDDEKAGSGRRAPAYRWTVGAH